MIKTLAAHSRRGMWTTAALCAALVLAGCGDSAKKDRASQTAAKVNKEEITVHQINFALQQQRGVRADQTEAASKEILERLIDQELAVQRAADLKIDRDPRVVMQLEAARREILSRAYFDRVGEAAAKPTPDEVRKYYDDNPALFSQRRVYSLQELVIDATPEQVAELRKQLAEAKSVEDFVAWLRANGYKFAANQAVRAAEQLPLTSLPAFAAMRDGQAVFNTTPTGAQVVVVAGSRMQPVDLQQATPAIEQFLLNDRKRNLVQDDLKSLRTAAAIQYVGRFADSPAAAGGAASAVPADNKEADKK
jgi:EpsD family peptidyl-prolyl cis-trans isomerase